MDIVVVEIILEEKIDEDYFLLPYLNNLDINYINRDIYIIQDIKYGNLNYSEGKIIDINNYTIILIQAQKKDYLEVQYF